MNWSTLTPDEQRIAYLLTEVSHDSVWGTSIHLFNNDRTVERLRQIIKELSSQTADNPGSMSRVIGWELVDLLLNHEVCV